MSKSHERSALPEFDPRLRYRVEEAAQLLRISRAYLFRRIKSGDIPVIKDGRRVFVAGATIASLSSVQS